MKILETINEKWNTTVLVVTHDKEMVNKLKKQVIKLSEGRIVKNMEKGKYSDDI